MSSILHPGDLVRITDGQKRCIVLRHLENTDYYCVFLEDKLPLLRNSFIDNIQDISIFKYVVSEPRIELMSHYDLSAFRSLQSLYGKAVYVPFLDYFGIIVTIQQEYEYPIDGIGINRNSFYRDSFYNINTAVYYIHVIGSNQIEPLHMHYSDFIVLEFPKISTPPISRPNILRELLLRKKK